MLLHFISDLLRNPELQRKFTKNPKGMMEEAGLTPAQLEALHAGSLDKVIEHLRLELSHVELFAAVWVKSVVEISSVTPDPVETGTSVQLQISGDFFALGSMAVLKQGTVELPGQTLNVVNAGNRGSRLTAQVQIPSNVPLGAYSVLVANPDGHYGSKDNALTIVSA
ncbi:hypothetical protein JQX13_13190 [Archangium violaceum]|uniref:hypothetical protein n=1 Tax=Archangium violaceum TaxID=83451 RepID=UPI00193C3842|nr:hypothetical protein [Archangium violaceum]QRK10937.1 hypothetical protein JQX13_13190 [Archangium violaceum]